MSSNQNILTKFCLLTTQRSGSTWLNELLGSHPEIKLFPGEIFVGKSPKENIGWIDDPNFTTFYAYQAEVNTNRPWTTFQYLKNLDDYPGSHKAIGFHLMYNQLADYPEILLKLIIDGYKIVHLERTNYLDTLISIANLTRRNIVHSRSKVNVTPIYLDVDLMWKSLSRQEEKISIIKRTIRFLPFKVHKITYDALCSDYENQMKGIAKFLNVSTTNIRFQSSLKKINDGSYENKIENYEEVYQRLQGTKYEKFLAQ